MDRTDVDSDALTAPVDGDSDTPADADAPPAPSRRNLGLLIAVAVAFGLAQLVVMRPSYGLGWDEAVYISQLDPDVPDAYWSSVRAWGTPLVAAPLAIFSPSLGLLRLYLMAVSSLGLVLAFKPWLKVRDSVAVPLAALLFASVWVTVVFGPQLLPNLYVALGAVAVAGLFVQAGERPQSNRVLVWLAVALGAVALLRPSDGLWLAVPLGVAWLLFRRWRRWQVFAAIGAGVGFGWAVWLGEAYSRDSTPLQRLRAASRAVEAAGGSADGGGGLDLDVFEVYFRMSNQRITCNCVGDPERAGALHAGVFLWYVGLLALVTVALAAGFRARRLAPVLVPLTAAVAVAFQYFFLLNYAFIRFLIPAIALLSIPAADGMVHLARNSRVRWPAAPAGVALLVLGHLVAQATVVKDVAPVTRRGNRAIVLLAKELERLGLHEPCTIAGHSAPNVAYYLRCHPMSGASHLHRTKTPLAAAIKAGHTVAAITTKKPPPGSYAHGWRLIRPKIAGQSGWYIYLPPDQPTDG